VPPLSVMFLKMDKKNKINKTGGRVYEIS